MTDSNFCRLCASDEGVFLDIFTATHRQLGNRSFLKEFETCFFLKVDRDEALSSKICHRCAIELGQCNQFVEKYQRVYEQTSKLNRIDLKKSCCMCLSTAKNNSLFTLAKDFRSTIDPLQKIYECFSKQITREEAESRLICVLCRYNLDLLYDLKKLAQEATSKLQRIAKSKAILASLPKTETFVVNRKTTAIRGPKLQVQTLSDSDSERGTMARSASRSKKLENLKSVPESKRRTCGQCRTSVEGGTDMYRLHSTGLTVCKTCWITMDPFTTKTAKKRKRQNQPDVKNTRMCAVFLTDVMSPASSKNNSLLKAEEASKGNKVCVISDDDSDTEKTAEIQSKKNLRNRGSGKAAKSDEESDTNLRRRLKRSSKEDKVHEDDGSSKKLKLSKTEETTASQSFRRSTRYQSSDSDSAKGKSKQADARNVKNDGAHKPKSTPKANSLESRQTQSKIKSIKNDGKHNWAPTETVEITSDSSASSSDSGVQQKLGKLRNKVPLIAKPKSSDNPKTRRNVQRAEPKTPALFRQSPAVPKSLNPRSIAKSLPSKNKPPPKKAKTLMMVSFPFKLKDPYECKVCRTEYRNKIVGMKHELTHFKQVEIKIEKLNITHHFQTTKTSSATELPDASCPLDSPSTNEKTSQSEVPTSTSPLGSDQDQGNKSDLETEDVQSVRRSRRSESIQRDDKSPDVADAKEIEPVSSSNGSSAEETTSVINDSKTETAANISPKLVPETGDELSKNTTSIAEADSATETNSIDENSVTKVSKETTDDNNKEELPQESDKTVNDIEDKADAEDDNDETVILSSSKTPTTKDVEGERDSGEEMESDTDIRIVDSGSSAEDSREQTEKPKHDKEAEKNVSVKKDTDEKSIATELESKTSSKDENTLDDESEADITSKICSYDNHNVENSPDDVSLQNEPPSQKEDTTSKGSQKNEQDVRPLSAVSEILQEVIDLATANVQKRVESDVTSVPETLENISEEINKNAEVSEALASIEATNNKESGSEKLDLNSPAISAVNDPEVKAADE